MFTLDFVGGLSFKADPVMCFLDEELPSVFDLDKLGIKVTENKFEFDVVNIKDALGKLDNRLKAFKESGKSSVHDRTRTLYSLLVENVAFKDLIMKFFKEIEELLK